MLQPQIRHDTDEARRHRERTAEIERRIQAGAAVFRTALVLDIPSSTTVLLGLDAREVTLRRLTSYTPTVGDSVLIGPSDAGWFVLGKLA